MTVWPRGQHGRWVRIFFQVRFVNILTTEFSGIRPNKSIVLNGSIIYKKKIMMRSKIFRSGHVVQVGQHGQLSAKVLNYANSVSNLLVTNLIFINKIFTLEIISNSGKTKMIWRSGHVVNMVVGCENFISPVWNHSWNWIYWL